MPKVNEIAQIEFIKNYLRKGENRKSIMGKFGNKWVKISRTTFDRRLRVAEDDLKREQENIRTRTEEAVADEVNARKIKILSAIERKEYLSSIISAATDIKTIGKMAIPILVREDGTKEIIYLSDKLKALSELNKMEGDYAPTKVAQTDSHGNDITQKTDEELLKRLSFLKKIK